jgi:DnaJ-class molecular chaperone
MLERAFTGFAALPPKGGTERPWWEVLGVTEHAPADVVKAAYRRLAAEHHPDRGGDQDKMAQLNRAYETAQARRMLGP